MGGVGGREVGGDNVRLADCAHAYGVKFCAEPRQKGCHQRQLGRDDIASNK